MAKLHLVLALAILGFAVTCSAAVYTVGDNSGWDISTDLDSWAQNKEFIVGDVLLFQYSSSHSVSEVSKENYEGCNTTNLLQSSSNGNTSFALTKSGDKYFVCGNRLHCLGGMKLHVNVAENQAASPTQAPPPPAGAGGSLPPGSSKSNNPSSVVPSSAMFNRVGIDFLAMAVLSFSAVLFVVV